MDPTFPKQLCRKAYQFILPHTLLHPLLREEREAEAGHLNILLRLHPVVNRLHLLLLLQSLQLHQSRELKAAVSLRNMEKTKMITS